MIRADILAESIDADDGRPAWSPDEFEAQLRENGKSYHIHHPFNVMLNTGHATPEQIRGWVANRYYYQIAIPVKDAAIMANCPDREVRRGWVQRILDRRLRIRPAEWREIPRRRRHRGLDPPGRSRRLLSENSEHQNFTLSVNPKRKYLFKNEPLILRNKKGHYEKQILDNISPEKIVISKNLNHFVTWGYDRYLVSTLGVKQNFKKINLTVPLEKDSLLSQELRLKYDNLFNNGVPIWGHVYRAKTNPLNNKVIGADKSIYKGMVLFIMKGESVASVTTYLEIKQMLEGDVVTEIFSNDDPSTGESSQDLGIWTTLGEYTKEGQNYSTYYVPTGKEAKETLSEIEISSDKKENNDSKEIIYNKLDFEAAYPGNDTAWFSFLKKNLDESVPARQGATDGNYTVVVGFVVDKNGDLSNSKALTNHGYGMENEAIRTLKKSSKWIPATIDGKNVSSHRVQPITFTVGK